MKIIQFIGRYFAIGILVGIGIYTVDYVYMETYGNERIEKAEENLNRLFDSFYTPGYKSFFDRLEDERPEALLSFSLARARLISGGIQVTGEITNAGPSIFNGYQVEVEAYNENGDIVAECDEWMESLDPGDTEDVVMNCPFVEGISMMTLSETSFRIKRSFTTKQAVDPDPFQPTPYYVGGELRGYRVYPGSDPSAFIALGLRPGDLFTEIDGQSLSQPDVATEMFKKALGGQAVQVSVVRDDELKTIEIKVD